MKCPACGHENTYVAVRCASCHHSLDTNRVQSSVVTVKLSKLAIAATICACVSWVCAIPTMAAALDPFLMDPRSGFVDRTGLGAFLVATLGFCLGVAGLTDIGTSGGRRTGHGFATIGTAAPAILILLLIGMPTFGGQHTLGSKMRCGTNLAGIGKAMLIYANDYEDTLPLAGGEETIWGPRLYDWTAASRAKAFGLDPNDSGGKATISSSLYLLVKYGGIRPKSFACGGDRQTKEFKPRKYGVSNDALTALWDFGPKPFKHCSYAWHLPYGRYALTTSSEPGLAVAADRNPWIDEPRQKARDFSIFTPDHGPFKGTAERARHGNTRAHRDEGQNVLFLDSHVEFVKHPYCGLDDDNIYTAWDGDDSIRGVPPKAYESQPANEFDSLLVNDPPLGR